FHVTGVQTCALPILSVEVQPGARHLHDLRQQLTAAGPSCVFLEPQFPTERVATLSTGLAVHEAELDPLGITLPTAAGSYEQLMVSLGNALAGCLEQL